MIISKKAISVVLASAMLLSLVGCGGKKSAEGENRLLEAKNVDGNDVFQESTTFNISDLEGSIGSILVRGEKLYYYTENWKEGEVDESTPLDASATDASPLDASETDAEEGTGSVEYKVFSASTETGDSEEIGSFEFGETEYVDRFMADKEGQIYLTVSEWGEEESGKSTLYKLDNGKLADKKDISKLTEGSDDSEDVWLSDLFMTGDGDIAAVYDDEVKVLDTDLNEKANVKADDYFEGVCLSNDGNIITTQTIQKDESSVTEMKLFNIKSGKYTKKAKDTDVSISSLIDGVGDYDFCYQTASAIYGYRFSNRKSEKVVDLAKSDISADTLGLVVFDGTDRMFSIDYSGAGNAITCYEKIDEKELKEKKIITLASAYGNADIKAMVKEFNKSQKEYKINMVDYSDEDDPAAKMKADIEAGAVPDIYEITEGVAGMSVDQCISKGMFADLTGHINSDPEIGENAIIPEVAKAMETNGKKYFVAQTFGLETLAGKKSVVGEGAPLTYADLKSLSESKTDAQLFASNGKYSMLGLMLTVSQGDFADWQAKKAHFDSDEFKTVLEIAAKGEDELSEEDYDFEGEEGEDIGDYDEIDYDESDDSDEFGDEAEYEDGEDADFVDGEDLDFENIETEDGDSEDHQVIAGPGGKQSDTVLSMDGEDIEFDEADEAGDEVEIEPGDDEAEIDLGQDFDLDEAGFDEDSMDFGEGEMDGEGGESETTMLKDGKLLFTQCSLSPEQIQMYESGLEGDYAFTGYPTKEGSGTYISFGNVLAISSKCKDVDGAWKFVRNLLTEEAQGKKLTEMYGMATRQDVFDVYLEDLQITKETKDKYENEVYPIEGDYSWEGIDIVLHPVTDDEINKFKEVLASNAGRLNYDDGLLDIVSEEVEGYFDGDQKIDATVKSIQKKTQKYMK